MVLTLQLLPWFLSFPHLHSAKQGLQSWSIYIGKIKYKAESMLIIDTITKQRFYMQHQFLSLNRPRMACFRLLRYLCNVYCISRNFRKVFIVANFANWITNAKIKTHKIYCLCSSIKTLYHRRHENVTLPVWIQSCWIWKICQWRFQHGQDKNITANISKASHVIGEYLWYNILLTCKL